MITAEQRQKITWLLYAAGPLSTRQIAARTHDDWAWLPLTQLARQQIIRRANLPGDPVTFWWLPYGARP